MIRPYHGSDVEALLEVWYEAAHLAYDFVPESFWATEREDIRTKYLPAAQTWVYEQDGAVVASISLLDNHIGGLFVMPSHQGRGIGMMLVEHARSLHTCLSLDVFKQNTQAVRFYERCGFAVVGESFHDATGCVNLRMQNEKTR